MEQRGVQVGLSFCHSHMHIMCEYAGSLILQTFIHLVHSSFTMILCKSFYNTVPSSNGNACSIKCMCVDLLCHMNANWT